jgi:hypothetical protein
VLHYLSPVEVQFKRACCCPPLPYKTNNGLNFNQPKKGEALELTCSSLGGVTDHHKVFRVFPQSMPSRGSTLELLFVNIFQTHNRPQFMTVFLSLDII